MGIILLTQANILAVTDNCFKVANTAGIKIPYQIKSDSSVYITGSYGPNHDFIAYPAIDETTSGVVTIPAKVTYKGHTYNVTGTSENAFAGCTKITKVE